MTRGGWEHCLVRTAKRGDVVNLSPSMGDQTSRLAQGWFPDSFLRNKDLPTRLLDHKITPNVSAILASPREHAMPRGLFPIVPLLIAVIVVPAVADDEVADLLKQVRSVGPQGAASPQARAAWDRLVTRGPAVLPALLEAMDKTDSVAANWLRTAFDRIVEAAQRQDAKGLETDALLRFAKDPKRQGRARRLALEVVESLQSGTRAKLLRGWTEDPEFGYDAIEQALADLDRDPGLPADNRLATLRELFATTR